MKMQYLACLFLLSLCCCKKKDTNTTPVPVTPLTFTTTYDSIINCYANSTYSLVFGVNVLTGNIVKDRITFAVSGLPSNITAVPQSQTVGPVQGGAFTFTIGNVPVGDIVARLSISTADTTQERMLIFRVAPPPDFAPKLIGNYPGSFDYCQPDTLIAYASDVTSVMGTPYQVKISNIKNLGSSFVVTATVGNGIVTIPLQTVSGRKIWGSGTFFHDSRPIYSTLYQLSIRDTIVVGTDTTRCNINIRH